MTKFIIADNQELTRIGIEAIIRKISDGNITYVEDKAGLIDLLKKRDDYVILLDYTLFDFSDVESLLIVSERFSLSQWILISEDLTDKFIRKTVYSSRNISIVFKDSTITLITDAINSAIKGKRYICQKATEILLEQKQKEELPTNLTSTEIEIIKSIAQGKTTKEIASERFSSVHTINTHRKNIFRKLGVNTAHEAVKYAFRAGLVDTAEFYI